MTVSDMWSVRGKTCMITGATSGIGQAAAVALARLGAELILVCRDRQRGEATARAIGAQTGAPRIDVMRADLSSQADVRRLSGDFLATQQPLHVLLNNAGVMMTERVESVDGIEMTLAVNHLAYFLLTNLLLERLVQSAPARIVNVTSHAHRYAYGQFNFDDPQARQRYAGMRVYGQSKLANILFTRELARRLAGTRVTVNCLHPGAVATRFGQNNRGIMNWGSKLVARFIRTREQGARTAVYLCASPAVDGVTGKYFYSNRERRPNRFALNDADARRLWDLSAQLVGLHT